MPNPEAAQTIATALATGLIHPGTNKTGPIPIPLPMFQPTGNQQQMAHFAAEAGIPHTDIAKLTAEATVHAVESADMTIINNTELAALRAAATAAEPRRNQRAMLHCDCGVALCRLNIKDFDTANPRVRGGELIKAMQLLSPECALNHRRPELDA
jgi:hypothetical protein